MCPHTSGTNLHTNDAQLDITLELEIVKCSLTLLRIVDNRFHGHVARFLNEGPRTSVDMDSVLSNDNVLG